MGSDLVISFHHRLAHVVRWRLSAINRLVNTPSHTHLTLGVRSLSSQHRQYSLRSCSPIPQKVTRLPRAHLGGGLLCACDRQLMTSERHVARWYTTVPDMTVKGSAPRIVTGSGSGSSLYVLRNDPSNVVVVDVDLGLEMRFANPEILSNDIRRRGIQAHIDVDQLVLDFNKFTEMRTEEETMVEGRAAIAAELKVLLKEEVKSLDFEKRKEALLVKGRNLRQELKLLHADFQDLEADMILTALRLPTPLSTDTPDEDEVLEEVGVKPDGSTATSHVEVGRSLNYFTPSTLSPGALYLHGAAARFELDAVDTMSRALRGAGMTQLACPDMTKVIIMEGCGEDFTDPAVTLTLEQKASEMVEPGVNKCDLLLGLCGGAALPAIIGYLCKMNVSSTSLPIKWFSVGRHYTPARAVSTAGPCLLRATQATQVSLFGAGPTAHHADQLYQDYISTLWHIYTALGVPLRRVRVGAQELLGSQSAATHIEAWLPSEDSYVKIAGVGVYDDFVSRRLMAKWAEDVRDIYSQNYLHMVYGIALDIPRLLAVLLESGTFPPKSLFQSGPS